MSTETKKIEDKTSPPKGKLLLVDDDVMMLKLMNNILSKVYLVKTAQNGKEALEVLKMGYRPGVIISDQIMPEMCGSEFLHESMKYVPNAARIVVTGTSDSKEIIRSINQSKALMYLNKPFERIDLIQAALLGFDHHKNKLRSLEIKEKSQKQIEELAAKLNEAETLREEFNSKLEDIQRIKNEIDKKLEEANKLNISLQEESKIMQEEIKNLMSKNDDLKNLIASLEIFPNQAVQSLTEMIKENEKHYFRKHSEMVVDIVKDIASDFQIEPDKLKTLLMAAVLHNVVILGMPDRLRMNDPMNMDEKLRTQYFKFFNRAIDRLMQIDLLKDHAQIISQIWEHKDGTGYPRGLYDDQISLESQILSVANIYHNAVYRLTPEQYNVLKQSGEVEQTSGETQNRHKDILSLLYKWTKWFDYDVLRAFQEKTKHKEIRATIPKSDTLLISFQPKNKDKSENEDADFDISFAADDEKIMDMIEDEVKATYEKRIIHPFKLKPGMITINAIKTINGVEVVPKDTVLNPAHLKKVKQLFVSELIGANIILKVPVYK